MTSLVIYNNKINRNTKEMSVQTGLMLINKVPFLSFSSKRRFFQVCFKTILTQNDLKTNNSSFVYVCVEVLN